MKKRRFLTLLSALCLALTLCTAAALASDPAGGECGNGVTWSLNAETGTLTLRYDGTTNVGAVAPGEMYDFTVGSAPWYEFREDIKSVVAEEGVKSIGNYSFYWCEELISVTFPTTLSRIGMGAFSSCTALTDPVFPAGLQAVASSAFENCDNLLNVVLPKKVEAINSSTFEGCDRLTSVTLRGDVMKIETKAFKNCSHLRRITLSATLKTVEQYAFAFCPRLYDVYYGGTAAYRAENLKIDNSSYASNGNNSDLLNALWHYESAGPAVPKAPDVSWEIANGTLYIRGTGDMYEFAAVERGAYAPWREREEEIAHIVIESGVTSICDNAFRGLAHAEDVSIPGTVASVGNDAFSGCAALRGIDFPDSVEFIWQNACSGCAALESAGLPSGLRNDIQRSLFEDCAALKAVVIPDTVTVIGMNAFHTCKELTSVTLSKALSKIENYAFGGCAALTDPVFPASLKTVGPHAFDSCDNLLNVVLPASMEKIDDGAFWGCDRLTVVTMLGGVTTIGDQAFSRCVCLRYVTLPDTLTRIGDYAFAFCSQLSDVYYAGTEQYREENLTISTVSHSNFGNNRPLLDAVWHYEATGPALAGAVTAAGRLTATVTAPRGARLIAASYDEAGRLLDVRVVAFENGCTREEVALELTAGSSYKLLLVDGVTFAPLSAAQSI